MKIDISGNGAEVVIGKLSEKQTQKIFTLLSKKKDEMGESEFETIMEKPCPSYSIKSYNFHLPFLIGSNKSFL